MEQEKKTRQEQNKLIVQGNKLVEGKYNYSLWELRVFIEMVQSIKRDDKEFKPVRIYLKDLIKQYDTKSNDDYRKITLAAVRLIRKSVKIKYATDKGEERLFHSPLVICVDTPMRMDDGFDKYIELQFPEKIRPLLLDLKKNYLLYDKKNILNLKSKFSVRIYQILKNHERESKEVIVVEYTVTELRNMLLVDDDGNPTNQYIRYSQFEKRVILIAQKELQESTDIAFSFDKIKRGRRYHSIKFYVRKNRKKKKTTEEPKVIEAKQAPKEQAITQAPDLNDPIYQTVAFQILIDKGVTQKEALKLVTDNEEDLILGTLDFCDQAHKQGTVKNLAAFIVSSIRNKTFAKEIEQVKAKKEAKQRAIEERRIKEQNHRYIQKLNGQFEELKKKKVEEIKANLTKEEEKKIVRIAKEGSPFVAKKTYEEVKNSIFFDFILVNRLSGTERLPKRDSDFLEWMKVNYKKEVIRNLETDKYELVS